jgi:hypothetical protein
VPFDAVQVEQSTVGVVRIGYAAKQRWGIAPVRLLSFGSLSVSGGSSTRLNRIPVDGGHGGWDESEET